ncbi:sensor domain-containing diguanylate cyclase [Marinospirillum insulare]|uniref:diguanylate cyclase n=1 Tax=Marinospirillum insulare TaxID=217169 RepID=A0ABQ5ZV15_9GAMM|nr:GGDEF domain-containing protein [Marinospirillum insulare]GLR64030.1 GGDEF domain-containing protein [Marinospirillum insulare]
MKPNDKDLNTSHQAVTTILDSLDALVYVADMETHELLFINEYGRKKWGDPAGRKCWQVLQTDQTGPCSFCTNPILLDKQGKPTGVQITEMQNTKNNQWYQCRDQAVPWLDGRLVRIEVATNITDRKQMEEDLRRAHLKAEQLADTDSLTGLNNRRAFFNLGKQLLHQAERNQTPVALIMFDLDYFKQINDQHGHALGDLTLVNIARIAEDKIRSSDVLARIGGEEFALLMPQTTLEQSLILAERLSNAFAENKVTNQTVEISCTASFGISALEAATTKSLDALIAEADKALYLAKNSGRNQIKVHE